MKALSRSAIDLLIHDHQQVKNLFEKYSELDDISTASKKKVADKICRTLILHTQIEEEIFYPAIRKSLKDDELMEEALDDHASASELMAEILEMDPEDHLYDQKIKTLSELIESHIYDEEHKIFPKVLRANIDLIALGTEIEDLKDQMETIGV